MKDHYSLLAPWYSSMAKLVFGESLKDSKLMFASDFSGNKLLFIGGGDGSDYLEIQEEIQGEYWELSKSMLDQARKNLGKSGLSFNLGNFDSDEKFDIICLPFVLDTMPDEELESLILSLKKNLNSDGKIFLSDFFKPISFRQKLIHQLMISFFRLATGHRRNDIPDYELVFGKAGFILSQEKKLLKGWVRAQLWELG